MPPVFNSLFNFIQQFPTWVQLVIYFFVFLNIGDAQYYNPMRSVYRGVPFYVKRKFLRSIFKTGVLIIVINYFMKHPEQIEKVYSFFEEIILEIASSISDWISNNVL